MDVTTILTATILVIIAIVADRFLQWMDRENDKMHTSHYEAVSENLPCSFDGFKILQISDFHNALFGDDNSRLIQKIEEANPDIIAITGDLVDEYKKNMVNAIHFSEEISKIAPCYYVNGNHESRLGNEYDLLENHLRHHGVHVLRSSTIKLEKEGQIIQLVGVDDPDFIDNREKSRKILAPELKKIERDQHYSVLLSHRPETFDLYVNEGFDLVLAGHAHGGQVRFPRIGGVVAIHQGIMPKYDAGSFTEGNTTMIVSRGVGNSICPIRINNKPEIVVVTLKRAG